MGNDLWQRSYNTNRSLRLEMHLNANDYLQTILHQNGPWTQKRLPTNVS